MNVLVGRYVRNTQSHSTANDRSTVFSNRPPEERFDDGIGREDGSTPTAS